MKVLTVLLALWGVITTSTADVYTAPSYSSSLESQVHLGTLVDVVEQNGIWVKVNIDHAFDGWITEKCITFMTEEQVREWVGKPKCICTRNLTALRKAPEASSAPVSPLVLGDSLVILTAQADSAWLQLALPDGRTGWAKGADMCATGRWRAENAAMSAHDRIEKVIGYATGMLGTPYVWGGVSSLGADCSGMVQLCFRMAGINLPRNSGQQFLVGEDVPFEHFEDGHWALEYLRRGDLLFFGTRTESPAAMKAAATTTSATTATATTPTAPKVSHVGIYLGDGRFIQSSHYVRINSLLSCDADVYENAHKLVGVKRIICE